MGRAVFEAEAVVSGLEYVAVVGEPVEQRGSHLCVAEDGQLEEIRPDESVDLHREGREQFITFKSYRSFRFVLDGRKFEWGLPFITGLQLKRLAGVDPNSYGVWLSQRVGDDKLIANKEKVDLQGDSTERFFTGIDTTTEGAGAAVLPPEDRD